MHPNVHCSTIYNSQDMEATSISTERWVDKDVRYIYTQRNIVVAELVSHVHGILPSHKREWNNAICSNMDGPRDYHTKRSKSEKDKYHIISFMCRIFFLKKVQMKWFTKQK